MYIIGVTGSSGAGKSTICDIIQRKYNAKVLSADKIAKKLSQKGTRYIKEVVEKFGQDILDENGELKRKKLAQIIYENTEKRKELNNCTFKFIKSEIEKQIQEEKDASNIIIDAPLLFECELDKMCNFIIGVISSKELQLDRIVARDNIDYEDAEKRLNAQETNDFYIKKCDEIIENNNNISNVEKKIEQILKKYNITNKLQ